MNIHLLIPCLTWLEEVHYLVERCHDDDCDEGKVPVDDKHDGNANSRSK